MNYTKSIGFWITYFLGGVRQNAVGRRFSEGPLGPRTGIQGVSPWVRVVKKSKTFQISVAPESPNFLTSDPELVKLIASILI